MFKTLARFGTLFATLALALLVCTAPSWAMLPPPPPRTPPPGAACTTVVVPGRTVTRVVVVFPAGTVTMTPARLASLTALPPGSTVVYCYAALTVGSRPLYR